MMQVMIAPHGNEVHVMMKWMEYNIDPVLKGECCNHGRVECFIGTFVTHD